MLEANSCFAQSQLNPDNAIVGADSTRMQTLASASATDADLNSIAIVSADRLCAVGNCGAILLTDNGGRTWEMVASPTTANLHSIAFFDDEHGLAVGGTIGNYTRTSSAIVLRTTDGGRSWTAVPNKLPRLLGIRIDATRVLCWGDYSCKLKTGVFESSDSGTTWRQANSLLGHVVAADISPDGLVAAVDSVGRFCIGPTYNRPDTFDQVRSLHHTGLSWLACGARGELKSSVNAVDWTQVDLPLSQDARRHCKWETIAQSGNDVWVGGTPGSILLHSPDNGESWFVRPTGQSLPVSQIAFIDGQRGWTVGPFGRILATRDGGRNWYAQRRGSKHASLFSIAAVPNAVPWSPLVAVSWDQRRLVASAIFENGSSDEHESLDGQTGFLPTRLSQIQSVAPHMGISTCTIEPALARSENATVNQLAVSLMTWRPDVVLLGLRKSSSESADQFGAKTEQPVNVAALQTAIQLASRTPSAQSSVLRELALSPWSVDKLAIVTESENRQYGEQSRRILKSLGLALWDILVQLPPDQREAAATTSLRTQWSTTHSQSAKTSLLGGVPPDTSTARDVSVTGLGNYQLLMGRIHRTKSVNQLLNYTGTNDNWKHDFEFVAKNLPAQEIEPVLIDIAQKLVMPKYAGRRVQVLKRMLAVRPVSDATLWAAIELLKTESSDEIVAWSRSQENRKGPVPIELAGNRTAAAAASNPLNLYSSPWNATPFGDHGNETGDRNSVTQASATREATAPFVAALQPRDWFQQYNRLSQLVPRIIDRPDMQILCYRMVQRSQGDDPRRLSFPDAINELRLPQHLIGWSHVAEQESRLAINEIADLHPLAFAPHANTRPQLDGQLDEAIWNAVPAMQLSNQNANEPWAVLRLAYDRQYLYMALECPKATGARTSPVQRIRTYDSDLRQVDHVQITLDTDRDYGSAIELAIAEDGRIYDRCCGRTEYDPKWYVHVESRPAKWTAEIAIELKYLTTQQVINGEAWAISARRTRPSLPVQSWNTLRSSQSRPEGRGLLLFLPAG